MGLRPAGAAGVCLAHTRRRWTAHDPCDLRGRREKATFFLHVMHLRRR